jgi:hypothetical protein
MKILLLLIVSLSLSGCFGGGQWMTYRNTPAPSYEYQDCKSYAADKSKAYLDDSGAYDESSALAAVAASFFAADSYADNCMKDKGYIWSD